MAFEEQQPFDPASFENAWKGWPSTRRAPIWTAPRAVRATPARSPCGWTLQRAGG